MTRQLRNMTHKERAQLPAFLETIQSGSWQLNQNKAGHGEGWYRHESGNLAFTVVPPSWDWEIEDNATLKEHGRGWWILLVHQGRWMLRGDTLEALKAEWIAYKITGEGVLRYENI